MKIVSPPLAICRRKGTWFALVIGLIVGTACWWLLPYQPRCSVALADPDNTSVGDVVYSPDFHCAAIIKRTALLATLWDLNVGQPLYSFPFKKPGGFYVGDCLAISPGSNFVVSFVNEKVTFRKIPFGELWTPEFPVDFSSDPRADHRSELAFDAEGRILVLVWDASNMGQIRDLISGKELQTCSLRKDHVPLFCGGFFEDLPDRKLIVRELPSGKKRGVIGSRPLRAGTTTYCPTPNCNTVAVIHDEIEIWNVATERHRTLDVTGRHVAISPDGRFVAVATQLKRQPHPWSDWLRNWLKLITPENETVLYDLSTDAPMASFAGDNTSKFSLDGRSLAINDGKTLRIYDFPLRRPWAAIVGYASLAAAMVWLLGWIMGRRKKRRLSQR